MMRGHILVSISLVESGQQTDRETHPLGVGYGLVAYTHVELHA